MGSVTASSARLRRTAPRSAVDLAGGKTGPVATVVVRLRHTQGQPKVVADPLPVRWWHGGRDSTGGWTITMEDANSTQAQQAKVRDDSLLYLPLC